MADQGASQLPRAAIPASIRFTGVQVLAMQDAGILPVPNRIELIDGELLDMGSEGERHSTLKSRLITAIARMTPGTITIGPGTTFRLAEKAWPEPDIYVFDAALKAPEVRGPDVLLVVEISDSMLAYDLKQKAALYARHGVREYWVIEAASGRCHVHQGPEGEKWRLVRVAEPSETLTASLAPTVAIRMADYG